MTAGFGLHEELEVKADLGAFFAAALKGQGATVEVRANTFFFQSPLRAGMELVDEALRLEPTLLVALDYLFWFAYGDAVDEETRMERLDFGLSQLDRLSCAILVADLPDMRPALRGKSPLRGGGPMIAPSQVPEPELLAKLDARLKEWAAQRERVRVVPMADLHRRFSAGEVIELAGERIEAEAVPSLLQADLLHPTVEGAALLTVLALEALRAPEGDPARASRPWSKSSIVAGVLELTAPAREERRAREKARDERRREREEARKEGGALAPR